MTAPFTSKADFYEGSPIWEPAAPAGITSITAGSPAVVVPGRPVDTPDLWDDPVWGNSGTAMVGTPAWPGWQFVECGGPTGPPETVPKWTGTAWSQSSTPDMSLATINAQGWNPGAAWAADQYLPYGSWSGYCTWDGIAFVTRPTPTWPT